MSEKHNNLGYCPGSGQDWVNFAIARQGHGWDPEIILHHQTSLLRLEGREPLPLGQMRVAEGAVQPCLPFCAYPSFPVLSAISTVAVTICFLISLLFPVNCSYLNP